MAGKKGMKFKSKRRLPTKINDGRICMYGCNSIASYEFGNGKLCCVQHGGNCPARRTVAIKKFINTVSQIDPITGIKKSVTMALKAADVLRNQIDTTTGLSRGITVRRQITQNSIKSGNRQKGITAEVMRKHATIDDATGLTLHQLYASKGRETRLNDIDEAGQNSYDRMWHNWHPQCHQHEHTGLYYQSQHELHFLESLNSIQCQKIRRGPTIRYIDPYDLIPRVYFPDFIIDNTVYEIKSTYSWYEWKGNPQRDKNIAKLNATLDAGFVVKLVIDHIEVDWPDSSY